MTTNENIVLVSNFNLNLLDFCQKKQSENSFKRVIQKQPSKFDQQTGKCYQ